mmetsp:Transcript_13325/g.53450  ORF Transcript_13325/g.53450 Transcript_13325/m.53450 type:complete len:490 (-) Transcript_13325:1770-3239(-)
MRADGAVLLTASHNPGGPDGDFGVKFNTGPDGAPAKEDVTDRVWEASKSVREITTLDEASRRRIADAVYDDDKGGEGGAGSTSSSSSFSVVSEDGAVSCVVEVVDGTEAYASLLAECFDLDAIRQNLPAGFRVVVDAMHGAAGPAARRVLGPLGDRLDVELLRCDPRPDFGGAHPDPNLKWAAALAARCGVASSGVGAPDDTAGADPLPDLGAALDGDGDRNMILGANCFVTPSDSLAVLAAKSSAIPWFARRGPLAAAARSMPTSRALDRVCARLGLECYETPTGWKYFGNLMERHAPFLCGEESFGTGADHVREKDGLWAVLAWLSVLAEYNPSPDAPLVSVQAIVEKHWATYGRNYYCRYDYEGVDKTKATAMMAAMTAATAENTGKTIGDFTIATADVFGYLDPVDGSVSKNQGLRFLMADGSRIVFRLSGTAGSGATVRLYLEKYDATVLDKHVSEVVGPLVAVAMELSKLPEMTGRTEPTVIT